MKKVILLLATILLTVGCNQKQKEQVASQESKPQLTAAEKRNMEIQDSLKKAKTDSLALIAWGDAKFGMSMKEALATEAFKGGDKYSNSITMDFDKKSKLGNAIGLSMFMILETEFKENELYLIRIGSYHLTADYIDVLIKDCDIFISNFTEKYGAPTYKKNRVNITDFSSGEEFEYAKFQVGDKSITILLGEDSDRYKYYYKIYISNSQFPKKEKVLTEKEKREIRERVEEGKK